MGFSAERLQATFQFRSHTLTPPLLGHLSSAHSQLRAQLFVARDFDQSLAEINRVRLTIDRYDGETRGHRLGNSESEPRRDRDIARVHHPNHLRRRQRDMKLLHAVERLALRRRIRRNSNEVDSLMKPARVRCSSISIVNV